MRAMSMFVQGPVRESQTKQLTKAVLLSLLLWGATMILMTSAFAQTGGATGTAAASQTRILGVVTGWQLIIFGIGAFILSGAFMYVGYSMAFGGKKWTDVAMVAYGAMIAGMGPMLVGWFFS
jgi:hypothetical protein